jgi:His/Glu/Gln/Arg/opine family amino acid ABC transporter permease subunit
MPSLLQGALIAIVVVICAEVIGTTVGLLLALCRLAKTRWLSWPALVYVDVIRGTPMLVQILIAYFGVPGLVMSITGEPFSTNETFNDYFPYIAGIAALGFNSAAYVSEIYRTAIGNIDKGQSEAARALGLSRFQTLRHIVLPQAFRWAIPPLGNEFITLLKDTSLLSAISVIEVVRAGQLYTARTAAVFPTYIGIALVYLAMTLVVSYGLRTLERKLKVPG